MLELILQLVEIFIVFGVIIWFVEFYINSKKTINALQDYADKLIHTIEQREEEIAEKDYNINQLSFCETMVETKESPYLVQYKNYTPEYSFIRLVFKSNKKKLMVSETYRNPSLALKNAEELACFLNADLEILE